MVNESHEPPPHQRRSSPIHLSVRPTLQLQSPCVVIECRGSSISISPPGLIVEPKCPLAAVRGTFNLPPKWTSPCGTLCRQDVRPRNIRQLYQPAAGFTCEDPGRFGQWRPLSAFEVMLMKGQLAKLAARTTALPSTATNIRIYKIRGAAAVTFYGRGRLVSAEEFCVLLTSSAGIATTRWTNCP